MIQRRTILGGGRGGLPSTVLYKAFRILKFLNEKKLLKRWFSTSLEHKFWICIKNLRNGAGFIFLSLHAVCKCDPYRCSDTLGEIRVKYRLVKNGGYQEN
jgi:hypothetical protein